MFGNYSTSEINETKSESDDLMQFVNELTCETCIYNSHCYNRFVCLQDKHYTEERKAEFIATLTANGYAINGYKVSENQT